MTPQSKVKDYMKTIYLLQNEGVVRGAYIAEVLNVSRPTVSMSLKKLEQEGYLFLKRDRTVWLTDRGTEIAEAVLAGNSALCSMLIQLGVDHSVAQNDAYNLERSISNESCIALISLAQDYLARNEV